MATNVDKSIYAAPQGLEALTQQEDPQGIEIEIENPDAVRIGIDGMEIEIEPGREVNDDFNANLAEDMDERELQSLSSELVEDYEADSTSRKDWIDTYIKGLKLLGIKYEARTEPWAGACGVFHPLLMESAVKFQSETIMETFPAAGPVKTAVLGKDTKEKADAAIRVSEDMNYELTERMI